MIDHLFEKFISTISKTTEVKVPNRVLDHGLVPQSFHRPIPTLFLQCGGKTEITLPNEQFILKQGDILVVPPDISHSERVLPPVSNFSNIVIIPDYKQIHIHCAGYLNNTSPIITDGKVLELQNYPLAGILNEIIDLPVDTNSEHRAEKRSRLFLLLLNLYRFLKEKKIEPNYNSHKINECIRLIDISLSDPNLSVKQLALTLNLHHDYLSNLFHQNVGTTLKNYINKKRMHSAQYLVKQTEMRSNEIAWICGYRSASYFNRLFKIAFGISPLSMRQKYPISWEIHTKESFPSPYYNKIDNHSPKI